MVTSRPGNQRRTIREIKMYKIKKTIAALLILIFAIGSISGCSKATDNGADGKLQIVTTIFPEYDWVKNVLGDNPANAELTLLLDSGIDLHSYQPTAKDILRISTCDMFIYVGGESDKWVDDALKNATNKNMEIINLLEVLGDSVKEEEIVEGMQDEEHDHEQGDHPGTGVMDHLEEGGPQPPSPGNPNETDDDDHEDHHEAAEVEYDEHVWLSLRNAEVLVNAVSESLQKIDKDNASVYKKNADAYTEKLNMLDAEYKTAIDNASVKTLLFADRFPFRYLVDDYGLKYYAAFVGCSAETEASFETISFLAAKADELSLKSILTIEKSDFKIANTVINASETKDRKILSLDSIQSTTAKDIENGATYLSIMESNLDVLKDALK